MSISTSSNLLASYWPPSSPTTYFNNIRAIETDETATTPPVTIPSGNPKCLGIQCDDLAATGSSYDYYDLASYDKYIGITATLRASFFNPTSNVLNACVLELTDGGTMSANTAVVQSDTVWTPKVTSGRVSSTAVRLRTVLYAKNTSTSNNTDKIWVDTPKLTVPEMMSRDSNSRKVHPDGCTNNGKGFYFDGNNDIISCESDLIGAGNVTCMFWAKIDDIIHTTYSVINNDKFMIYFNNAAPTIVSDGGVGAQFSDVSSNTWIHYAFTRDSSGTARLYVNGSLDGYSPSGTPTTTAITNTMIGNKRDLSMDFKGSIDDLQIYSTILTEAQMRRHYDLTKRNY